MQSIRALFLATTFDLPELHTCLGLQAAGIEVHVIACPNEPFKGELLSAGIPLTWHRWRSRFDRKGCSIIRREVRKGGRVVLHTLSSAALSNSILATIGISVPIIGYRGTMGHLSRWDPSTWLTYFNPRLDKIICNSHAVAGYLRGIGIPDKKVAMIYKGHDISWYAYDSSDIRRSLNIPEDAFVVGCAATIRPVKGVDLLIAGFERLADLPDIRLLLVGENRDPEIARRLANSKVRERIIHVGFKSDAPRYIGACNLSALLSREREGFPKAVIEAMAQGVPVLVSAVGGMREMVEHGTSGLVLEDLSAENVAGAIRVLYHDRRQAKALGVAAQARVGSHFAIRNTVQQTIGLYQSLLS